MIAIRPHDEIIDVSLSVSAAALAVTGATHAWVAGPLFGICFVLRFALQPPAGVVPTRRRGLLLALLGWVTLACVVWAIGVRVAHWPG